jgi:hypothetical protein
MKKARAKEEKIPPTKKSWVMTLAIFAIGSSLSRGLGLVPK